MNEDIHSNEFRPSTLHTETILVKQPSSTSVNCNTWHISLNLKRFVRDSLLSTGLERLEIYCVLHFA